MTNTETQSEALFLATEFEIYAAYERPPAKGYVARAAAELRRLDAENKALRADADRYRWLKTPRLHVGHGSIFLKIDDRSREEWPPMRDLLGEEMDCAIDAAREIQKGGAA